MSRTTPVAMTALLAVALLAPVAAHADEAAGHYNLAVQFKREGKITDAIASKRKSRSRRCSRSLVRSRPR